MLKSFNYTQQFTMAEIDNFGEDRANMIRQIMLTGLIREMDKDGDLFETESVYDPRTNTVRVRFGIHGIEVNHERKPVDVPLEWEHKKETLIGPIKRSKSGINLYILEDYRSFPNRDQVKYILNKIGDIFKLYGIVTVADYYELIGKTSYLHDHKFGWVEDQKHAFMCKLDAQTKQWMLVMPPASKLE